MSIVHRAGNTSDHPVGSDRHVDRDAAWKTRAIPPEQQHRRPSAFPTPLGRRRRRPHAPHALSSVLSNTTSRSRISTIRCDTDRRNLTPHRRYAPTSVHLRRNPRSPSADSAFTFSDIRRWRRRRPRSVPRASGLCGGGWSGSSTRSRRRETTWWRSMEPGAASQARPYSLQLHAAPPGRKLLRIRGPSTPMPPPRRQRS